MTTGYQWAFREKTAQLRRELNMEQPDIIALPWPPKNLNPNARVHWAVKSAATKSYKNACAALLASRRHSLKNKTRFAINFRASDNRRRDTDNIIASIKGLLDVLALQCGVDDTHFEITYTRTGVCRGGAVEIEVLG